MHRENKINYLISNSNLRNSSKSNRKVLKERVNEPIIKNSKTKMRKKDLEKEINMSLDIKKLEKKYNIKLKVV